MCKRFDIVDERRAAVDTLLGRKRWLTTGKRKVSLHRGNDRSLLTADVKARGEEELQRQISADRMLNLRNNLVRFPPHDGFANGCNYARISWIDVNNDVSRPRRDSGYQCPLDHLMRRVLQQKAILERAGLVLITVGDHVFLRM